LAFGGRPGPRCFLLMPEVYARLHFVSIQLISGVLYFLY
jgi:hypothetical protein